MPEPMAMPGAGDQAPKPATPTPPAPPTSPQVANPPVTPTAPAGAEDKNVFAVLNDQTKTEDKGVMDTIIGQKDKNKETSSVLDTAALKKLGSFAPSQTLKEEQYVTLSKIVLGIVVVLAIGVHGFFYSQLSEGFNYFGANVYQKWDTSKQQLILSHNELTKRQLILAQINLDSILGLSQSYEENAQDSVKQEIIEKFKEVKKNLNVSRSPSGVQSQYETSLEADNAFRDNFLANLDGEINDLKAVAEKQDATSDQIKESKISIQMLESVKKMYQRQPIRTAILAIDLEGGEFDGELAKLVKQINELSQTNFSIIKQIQGSSIEWAPVIKKITSITQKIDPHHASKRFRNLSSIEYNSFSLSGDQLTISGTIKTKDSKNFSQIANLIDLLEKEKLFKDVTKRAFAKTFDAEKEVFISSIQIQLTLQEGDDDRDKKESLAITKVPVQ